MSAASDPRARRWAPIVAVVATIAALTVGGRVAATIARDAVPATVGVDGVATIEPPPGWTENVEARRGDGASQRFVLTKGSAIVAVTAVEDAEVAAPTLAARYRLALEERAIHLVWTRLEPVAVGGLPGVRFSYGGLTSRAGDVEGVVTVAVSPGGSGLILDGVAPEGALAAVAGDLAAMAEGAHIG